MTDETTKPKHKRRRWFIAGVLLFVGSVLGWWYWPRGDARFVGRWKRLPDGSEIMMLRWDGRAYFTFQGSRPMLPMDWGVQGDRLMLGPQTKLKADFLEFISPAYRIATGQLPYYARNRLTILSVTPNELRVLHPKGETLTYRRIPE